MSRKRFVDVDGPEDNNDELIGCESLFKLLTLCAASPSVTVSLPCIFSAAFSNRLDFSSIERFTYLLFLEAGSSNVVVMTKSFKGNLRSRLDNFFAFKVVNDS